MKKIINRSLWIAIIVLIMLLCIFGVLKQKGSVTWPKRPKNILLISLDACRADHLSCYGYDRLTSPFMDELSEKGVRFENAFVNTHGTPPSHLTMLSSLYTETHHLGLYEQGLKSFLLSIPENIPLVQEILQENGYITLGVAEAPFFSQLGFGRGFTETYTTKEVSVIDHSSNMLLRLIKKYSKENKPIFAFFHTYEIHAPYIPPKDYMQLFGNYSSKKAHLTRVPSLLKYTGDVSNLSPEDLEYIKVMYDREIRFSDDVLKKLFAALDELCFFDNYLVIITADHGEEFGDHGGLMHRGLLYDELLHVPLIIVGTDIPGKKVIKQMVESIDIMPTILGIAGINVEISMEGKNLFSKGKIESESQEQAIFSQYGNLVYSIRSPHWKLIETRDQHQYLLELKNAMKNTAGNIQKKALEAEWSSKIELYDLINDPKEHHDLSTEKPEIVNALLDKLIAWREIRLHLGDIKKRKIDYDKKALDKLHSLGYLE